MAANTTATVAAEAANNNNNSPQSSPESSNPKSSPESSPAQQQQQQLNTSVDSGIAVIDQQETQTLKLRQRLQQCQRILQVLQRDQPTYQQLRDRLR